MLRNKKADASDGMIILIMVFFLAVSFIVVAFFNDKLSTIITTTALNQTSVAAQIGTTMDRITTNGIQQGFVMIFAFLVIGTMLSSFLVRVHPGFLFLYILLAGFTVIVGVVLANAYNAVIQNATLNPIAGQQTMITWVMTNIIKIMIATIALSVIVLLAKPPEIGGLGVGSAV